MKIVKRRSNNVSTIVIAVEIFHTAPIRSYRCAFSVVAADSFGAMHGMSSFVQRARAWCSEKIVVACYLLGEPWADKRGRLSARRVLARPCRVECGVSRRSSAPAHWMLSDQANSDPSSLRRPRGRYSLSLWAHVHAPREQTPIASRPIDKRDNGFALAWTVYRLDITPATNKNLLIHFCCHALILLKNFEKPIEFYKKVIKPH